MLKLAIDVFTHFFKVSEPDSKLQMHLTEFVKVHLLETTLEYVDGHWQRIPGRVFAARTKDKREYRFHIHCLETFKTYFAGRGYEVFIDVDERENLYPGDDATFHKPKGFALRDYQIPISKYILEDGYTKIVELHPGAGKGLDLDTLVRLKNEWVPIKDIRVGDEVLTPNGDAAKVVGVFDNKNMDCYKITFHDGRSCVCDIEHLWEVFTSQGRHGFSGYRTMGMKEVIQRYEKDLRRPSPYKSQYIDLKIPLVFPLDSADREVVLPVDPYVLGVFLGDGNFDKRGRIQICKPDLWIKGELDRILKDVDCVTSKPFNSANRCLAYNIRSLSDGGFNTIKCSLDLFGLRGKRSWEKFIPDVYLNASFEQRLALVQGLMDTDGSVNTRDGCGLEISTASKKMGLQILELVRSLGAIASLTVRDTFYTYKGKRLTGRTSYRIRVRAQIPSMFFRTPVKKNKTKDDGQYLIKGLKLRMKTIEYVGKRDTRCIKVDHPDEMYVIQDYICTHNTSLSLWAASEYGKKLCIFVLGRYTERWWSDVGLWVDDDKILEIRGSLELEEVLRQSDTPFIRDKHMFVMTITTFSDYCTKWEVADADKRKEMVPPELVWEALGVGMRITDETHQHFQQNFLADLYTHLPKTVYLSATLHPGDGFIRRMYETMLPIEKRVGGGLQRKYTNVYAMFYRFRLPHLIRCNNRKRMYNHTEFEKWLMRNPKTLENYFAMIDEIIEERFIAVRKEGQKQLIFFGTKKMCEKYVLRLKRRFPSLDCRKYVSEDKYENLLKADIACSTLGSSGTAVDIPNLLRCLMTVALKSEQANLQALGRLRYMEDQVEFDYLVCTDIPKHRDYHYKKKKLFKDWVKSHQELYTEKTL